MTEYIKDDGGRANAGYKGYVGDCVVRAICIATGSDYKTTYLQMNAIGREFTRKPSCARTGVTSEVWYAYMKRIGWQFVPLPTTGSRRTNLKNLVLPEGNIVIHVKGHAIASVDGVLRDVFNPLTTKHARRLVQGYFRKAD